MTLAIVVTLIVLILMTLAIFFLLKYEVKKMNEKAKVYFTLKTQEYTSDVLEKEPKAVIIKNIEEEKKEKEKSTSVIYVDQKDDYVIDNLFSVMKHVDDKFSVDPISVIKKFIKENVKNQDSYHYDKLIEMKSYINKIGIYNIVINDDSNFIQDIMNHLRLIDEDIYNEFFLGKDEFNIEDFINYLDFEIGKYDPNVYVYVGDKSVNYDKLDKRIKTIYNAKIYKGVKIVYKNILYDYSLS